MPGVSVLANLKQKEPLLVWGQFGLQSDILSPCFPKIKGGKKKDWGKERG